jgi:hypothetical protein
MQNDGSFWWKRECDAFVQEAPDGNLWVTVRETGTETVIYSAGPYTNARHFLDVCRQFNISREAAEELHDRAKRSATRIVGPTKVLLTHSNQSEPYFR